MSISHHYIKLFLIQVMWAGTFIASEIALNNIPPLFLALVRFILTFIIFLIIFRKDFEFQKISNKDFIILVIMGFFGVFLYTYLLYYGLTYSNSVYASLLIPTTQPIITMGLTILLLKVTIKRNQLLSILLGFIGAIIIILDSFIHINMNNFIGSCFIILAAFSFSIYSVCTSLLSKDISSNQITLLSTFFGTIILTIMYIIIDEPLINTSIFNENTIYALFYLVFLATIVPYIWWNNAIKEIGSITTGSFTLLLPPIAILLTYLILKHTINLYQLLGTLIIMISMIIIVKGKTND